MHPSVNNGSDLYAHEIVTSSKTQGTVKVMNIDTARNVIEIKTTADLRHGFEQDIVCGGFGMNARNGEDDSQYIQLGFGKETTGNLALNATVAEVKAALEALSSVAGSTVEVQMLPSGAATTLCFGGNTETGNKTITKVKFSHVYLTSSDGRSGIDEQAPSIVPLLYGAGAVPSAELNVHSYRVGGLIRGDVVLLDGHFFVVSTDRRRDIFDNNTIILSGSFTNRTSATQLDLRFFPLQEGALSPDFVHVDQEEVIFSDGSVEAVVPVTILDDDRREGIETFSVSLSHPRGRCTIMPCVYAQQLVCFANEGLLSLQYKGYTSRELWYNSSAAELQYAIQQMIYPSAMANDTSLNVTVRLNGGSTICSNSREKQYAASIVFHGFSEPPAHLQLATNSLSSNLAGVQPFAYVVVESPSADDDNNGFAPSIGSLSQAQVQIVDTAEDFGGNVSFLQATSMFHEQDRVALIPVQRKGGYGGELNVQYSTKDVTAQASVNYEPRSDILTFPSGVSRLYIIIPLANNHDRTGNVTFQVNLLAVGGTAVRLGGDGGITSHVVTIIDDESGVAELSTYEFGTSETNVTLQDAFVRVPVTRTHGKHREDAVDLKLLDSSQAVLSTAHVSGRIDVSWCLPRLTLPPFSSSPLDLLFSPLLPPSHLSRVLPPLPNRSTLNLE